MVRKKRRFGQANVVSKDIWEYNVGLIGESGIGKEQPLSAEIITPTGVKTMGDMEVGSKVIGRHGKACNVVGVYPQGTKPIYQVKFSDGSVCESGLEHLWRVIKGSENPVVVELKDIISNMKKGEVYYVELPDAVEFESSTETPTIAPMLLGMILAKGYTEPSNSDDFKYKLVLDMSYDNSFSVLEELWGETHKEELDMTIKDNQVVIHNGDIIIKELNAMGFEINGDGVVLKTDSVLDMPYVYAEQSVREGIMNGIIAMHNPTMTQIVRFEMHNQKLAKYFRYLAKSLGFNCSANDLENTEVSLVEFSLMPLRIDEINYVRDEEAQCIMLDDPEHLYLTNDFVVTHNTTLMKNVCEKLVGRDGYILLDMGREDGTKAISGVIRERVTTFEHQLDEITGEKKDEYKHLPGVGLMDIVDDIIENKDELYPDLKILVSDTLDQLIDITEKHVVQECREEYKETGKEYKHIKSINAAYSGFMRGETRVVEKIQSVQDRLRAVGVAFWIVGHTKKRTRTDAWSGIEYDMLSTELSDWYFNKFKTKLHFLGVLAVDRKIDTFVEKNSFSKEKKVKGKIVDEKRFINFRDDNYSIDSKSRFSDIEPSIKYGADEFIKAIQDAINKERSKDVGIDMQEIEVKQKAIEDKNKEVQKTAMQDIVTGNVSETDKYAELETAEIIDKISTIIFSANNKMELAAVVRNKLAEFGVELIADATREQIIEIYEHIQ